MNESKRENLELKKIEAQRIENVDSIAALNEEINELTSQKDSLLKIEKYQKLTVYNIVKKSNLDHIIIGAKDLKSIKNLYADKLGFTIKDGTKHKNGLENIFIEFNNETEIELISVSNPTDDLAQVYDSLINKNQKGLYFALRTDKLADLKNYISSLDAGFDKFSDLNFYESLSKNTHNSSTPFFFIKYKGDNQNKLTNHENGSKGISAVWLSTSDIRTSVKYFSEFGFGLVDTISIADIKKKTALIKNENFEIILVEDNKNQISGITITVTDIKHLANLFNDKFERVFKVENTKRGKSLYLNPSETNSVYFEFIEN